MKISFNTHYGGLDTSTGYGYAGFHMVAALNQLGHEVPFNDITAPVMLNFTQPPYYNIVKDQYTIGYTPWESTKLEPGWQPVMNSCDEVWTTSDLMADWFKKDGIEKDVFVFEHGIEHIWEARLRRPHRVLNFLHVGEPAGRKCGQMVVNAFGELFGNDPRYHLTIKANGYNTTRVRLGDGMLFTPDQHYKNITLRTDTITTDEMVSLYWQHDVLLYPSYGEGFGFIPLQGMATGMPVILNPTWAPYRRFSVGLDVKDRLVKTKWEIPHPGMMLEPNFESLKEQMLEVAENYEKYAGQAYDLAPEVHRDYDWQRVTSQAFEHILRKF